jgi:hypothetical protein
MKKPTKLYHPIVLSAIEVKPLKYKKLDNKIELKSVIKKFID